MSKSSKRAEGSFKLEMMDGFEANMRFFSKLITQNFPSRYRKLRSLGEPESKMKLESYLDLFPVDFPKALDGTNGDR